MSREQQLTKLLNEAIQKPELYSEEELRFMKTQLRSLIEQRQVLLKEEKNGFGS
jgi:hypothetical protein